MSRKGRPQPSPRPIRWIDLHIPWMRQYVGETTDFDAADEPPREPRLGQVEGYLGATSAAFVVCRRSAADWARRPDRWAALDTLIARVGAEFPGRLLVGPEDLARWQADPDGLAWAVLCVESLGGLVRSLGDLDRLAVLDRRGVRVFGLGGECPAEAGAPPPHAILDRLESLAAGPGGPRPIVDLAALGPADMALALDWFEQAPRRLLPLHSLASVRRGDEDAPTWALLGRLRALGGTIGVAIGPQFVDSAEALRDGIEALAALPYPDGDALDGIAFASDFLGDDQVTPGLENAEAVAAWAMASFDPASARRLLVENAAEWIRRACG